MALTTTAALAAARERITGTRITPPKQISWENAQKTRVGTTDGGLHLT